MPRTQSQLKRDIEPPRPLSHSSGAIPLDRVIPLEWINVWTGKVCQLDPTKENIQHLMLWAVDDQDRSSLTRIHDHALMSNPEVDIVQIDVL